MVLRKARTSDYLHKLDTEINEEVLQQQYDDLAKQLFDSSEELNAPYEFWLWRMGCVRRENLTPMFHRYVWDTVNHNNEINDHIVDNSWKIRRLFRDLPEFSQDIMNLLLRYSQQLERGNIKEFNQREGKHVDTDHAEFDAQ